MATLTIPRLLAARKDGPPKRVRVRLHQPEPAQPGPDAAPVADEPWHHCYATQVDQHGNTVRNELSWHPCTCEIGSPHDE